MTGIETQKRHYERTKCSVLTCALLATFACCLSALLLAKIATPIAAGLLGVGLAIPALAGIGLALYRQWFNW
jgi:hypothetical protein